MKKPTPTAWDFLGDLGLHNPELARKLRDEIAAGTFILLDGEPATLGPDPRQLVLIGPEQLELEVAGRGAA
jgi:hypothetical protein